MFENIIPPQKRRRAKKVSATEKAIKAAKEAKREQDAKIAEQAGKLSNLRQAAKKRKEKIDHALDAVTGKNPIVSAEEILEAPAAIKKELIKREVAFEPNPGPQLEFLAASEKEVFYGGARGGGKSYSLIVDPLRYCDKETARALILRRTMPELRDLINHSQSLYRKAYPGARWREQEKEWRFPSGARIEFGYAETRQDALRYQGQSYSWIGVDELPQYPTQDIWNDLRGSLRSVDPTVPEFMRATGNPGNIGSAWVKELFIDPAPWNTRFETPIELPDGTYESISRRFIPAKLSDNPYLTRTKAYMTMLASLPEIQKKQWLEGNWDVWEGAAFPEFKREVHVCEPFELPKTWVRFRCCDWGYASPAVCLWIAVDYDNNLWVYREFKTKGMSADVFARRIMELERGEKISYGVMDSSVWSKRGDVGPGIIETMAKEGCRWRPSDRSPTSRLNGKMEVHRRLALSALTNQPTLKIFRTCLNIIKELPVLPIDENDPEDVNTKANDHSYDALRYGCMSRMSSPTMIDWANRSTEREAYKPADVTFGY